MSASSSVEDTDAFAAAGTRPSIPDSWSTLDCARSGPDLVGGNLKVHQRTALLLELPATVLRGVVQPAEFRFPRHDISPG